MAKQSESVKEILGSVLRRGLTRNLGKETLSIEEALSQISALLVAEMEKKKYITKKHKDLISQTINFKVNDAIQVCQDIVKRECGEGDDGMKSPRFESQSDCEDRINLLEDILRMALTDDKFNDHSSGVWQTNARKALGIEDEDVSR